MGNACCRVEQAEPVIPDTEVSLRDFEVLRSIGKGSFGKVRIVKYIPTGHVLALKYIRKVKCIELKAETNVMQERRILEMVENAFICNLRYAFQDEDELYMVLDLMTGGDLRFHLKRLSVFTREMIQLYVGEISSALCYLHDNNIVHRDVKPDNVLLDEHGHAHLTDFNVAIKFNESELLTSITGTLPYMAPEILLKNGYLSSIDWWSLGVMTYEMALGKRPFKGKSSAALVSSVLDGRPDYSFAELKLDDDLLSLIRSFLQRHIELRLGTKETGGIRSIKLHPFFSSLNWDDLEKKTIKPTFKPNVKQANFESKHELNELISDEVDSLASKSHISRSSLVNSSLISKLTTVNAGTMKGESVTVSAMSKFPEQQKLMEENFKPFDFRKRSLNAAKTKEWTNVLIEPIIYNKRPD